MAENLEPTRRQLHDRLDFVATEIESSLVRGESASGVEFETLLGRVRALLAAAVETAAVTAVSGTRRVCAVVDPVAAEEAAQRRNKEVEFSTSEPVSPQAEKAAELVDSVLKDAQDASGKAKQQPTAKGKKGKKGKKGATNLRGILEDFDNTAN